MIKSYDNWAEGVGPMVWTMVMLPDRKMLSHNFLLKDAEFEAFNN